MTIERRHNRPYLSSAIAALLAGSGHLAVAQDNVFELGKLNADITVIGEAYDSDLTDNTVTIDDVWKFNRNTLDEAVKLIPGVTSTLDGTARRNERGIYVRGFGRWQVPLSIDGIRIYLPADNRLDFSRFLTQDLAEIDVQKGYVSVLDGPGGMGGAINLVTRKPTESFESEVRLGYGDGERDAYASVGTRHDGFYVQGSASVLDRDYWRLSDDFVPTSMEDGSRRDGSDNEDSRLNLKVGFTPNDTDEYSISYTAQTGEKGAPLHVYNNPPNPPNSFWRWPTWDIGNLYWLSSTALGADDQLTLKTKVFFNTYENSLFAYDNANYTTQSGNGRFQSFYDDEGYGGSVELGTTLGSRNTFGAALHYRRDEHTEFNDNRPTAPFPQRNIEPLQKTDEETWSIAIENTFAATDKLDLVAGLSHDANDLNKAEEFNTTAGLFEYPTGGSDANNLQGAAYWEYATGRQLRGVISSRTRFPTIFERFSTRFGSAIPNPNLEAERAVNYELGWSAQLSDAFDLTTALFYADVEDMIQTVVVVPNPQQTQTQNVGDGELYGVELGARAQLSDLWAIAANYTHLEREIHDPLQPTFEVVGAPDDSAFVAFIYEPTSKLTITPSLELASDRWAEVGTNFIRTGDYSLLNLQVQYRGADAWEIAAGGSNLTDENVELAYGYPEAGRNVYVRLRLNF
jgi:iron complex outermembrane receptor protein